MNSKIVSGKIIKKAVSKQCTVSKLAYENMYKMLNAVEFEMTREEVHKIWGEI